MKKIYNNPTTKVVKLQPMKIMAGSMKYGGTTREASGNLSRRNDSFWDDEEDE